MIVGIFVGGQGRRMGGVAKGLMTGPRGDTILAAQRSVLMKMGLPHVLVGERPEYAGLGLQILRDDPRADGPFGGLLALLARAGYGHAIALACDMPFVGERDLRSLVDAPAGPAVAPRRQARWEPFFARYDARAVLPVAIDLAERGVRSLQALLDRSGARELEVPSDAERVLVDWDTPEDVVR